VTRASTSATIQPLGHAPSAREGTTIARTDPSSLADFPRGLRRAIAILRRDRDTIRSTAADPRSLLVGIILVAASGALFGLVSTLAVYVHQILGIEGDLEWIAPEFPLLHVAKAAVLAVAASFLAVGLRHVAGLCFGLRVSFLELYRASSHAMVLLLAGGVWTLAPVLVAVLPLLWLSAVLFLGILYLSMLAAAIYLAVVDVVIVETLAAAPRRRAAAMVLAPSALAAIAGLAWVLVRMALALRNFGFPMPG
jgi:hypothetical protein